MPYINVAKPTGANYTNVGKPSGAAGTLMAGMTMGLLIPLTNAVTRGTPAFPYTKVFKPTNSTYSNIAKPT